MITPTSDGCSGVVTTNPLVLLFKGRAHCLLRNSFAGGDGELEKGEQHGTEVGLILCSFFTA